MSAPDNSKLYDWLLPLLAMGALASLLPHQADVVAVADMRLLSLLSGVVLAALVGLGGGGGARKVVLAASLVMVTVGWIAPADPHRGALVVLILVLCLGLALARTWFDPQGRWRGEDRLDFTHILSLAIALQALIRCDLLLPPLLEPRDLVRLILLPTVAAGSLAYLARFFAAGRVFLVGAVAVLSTPGWNTTVTLALLALAAGAAAGWSQSRLVKVAGVGILAILPLWQPPLGALLALAGAGVFLRDRGTLPIVALAAGLTVFFADSSGRFEALELWLFGVLLLVPSAFLAGPGDRAYLRVGAVLALAAALLARAPEAMVGGLGLMALAVPTRGSVAALQGVWTATLAAGTVLLASFPWLRRDPRADFLALLGLESLSSMIVPAALILGLGLLFPLADSWPRRLRPRPWAVAGLVLAWALLRGVSPSLVVLERYQAAALDSEQNKSIFIEYPEQKVSAVLLETSLAHGLALEPGTPVARVKLRGPGRGVLREWPIRAGIDTAEWASSRPDVRALGTAGTLDPWISFPSPDGRFFANHFRAVLRLAEPAVAGSITIDREKDLPTDVLFLVYRVELRP